VHAARLIGAVMSKFGVPSISAAMATLLPITAVLVRHARRFAVRPTTGSERAGHEYLTRGSR
jgi:hypothetical protein